MKRSLCELIASFVGDPKGLESEIRSRRDEVFAHLDVCDVCADRIDAAAEPELVLEVLAADESALAAEESRQIDELIRTDTAREDEIRKAVEDALIPSLGRYAASVAKRYDPLILYGATEGVSLLIRRHITLDRPNAELVQLHRDGSVSIDLKSAIPSRGVTIEIARFTGLWVPAGLPSAPVKREPSDEASELATWIFEAARDRRNLLRHFRVDPLVAQKDALTLVPLAPGEQVDDPVERWSPEKTEEAGELLFALPEGAEKVCLFAIGVENLGVPLSAEAVTTKDTSMQKPICSFLARAELVASVRTASDTRKFLFSDGFIHTAEAVGFFEQVSFEGREVRLSGAGRQVRGVVERTVFPSGVKPL